MMSYIEIAIKNNYYFDVSKIEKNKESTQGNVYIIETNLGKYVTKIYNDVNHTKSMINLHTYLFNNNFYIPSIIKNKKNLDYSELSNNKFIVIYSFLEGNQIKERLNNFNSEIIIKIATYLRKFHDITSKENKFNLKQAPIKNNIKIDRNSALHFDITTGNIFYNDDRKQIGFIDFDDAQFGPSIIDVSIAVGNLFFSKKRGVNLEGAKLFIDTYYRDDKELKEKEVSLIKDFAIKWIEYIMNTNEFNTSTKDSFDVRKKLIKNIDFSNL